MCRFRIPRVAADSARGGTQLTTRGFRWRTWGLRLRAGVGSPRLIVARRSMQRNTASGARRGLAEQCPLGCD